MKPWSGRGTGSRFFERVSISLGIILENEVVSSKIEVIKKCTIIINLIYPNTK